MPKQDFILDIRRHWSHLYRTPFVVSDSPNTDVAVLSRKLQGLDLWLTPKAVEEYRPDDFGDLPSSLQDQLAGAVADFRSFAATVAPHEPATEEQYRHGRLLFERIAGVVKEVVLSEWLAAVRELIDDAERWCQRRQWPTRREQKDIREELLGKYEAPVLLLHAHSSLFQLSPVARFTTHGLGLADVALVPSYDFVTILRNEGGWQVNIGTETLDNGVEKRPWSEDSFVDAVEWLRRQA